jgi:hypothetical protein
MIDLLTDEPVRSVVDGDDTYGQHVGRLKQILIVTLFHFSTPNEIRIK